MANVIKLGDVDYEAGYYHGESPYKLSDIISEIYILDRYGYSADYIAAVQTMHAPENDWEFNFYTLRLLDLYLEGTKKENTFVYTEDGIQEMPFDDLINYKNAIIKLKNECITILRKYIENRKHFVKIWEESGKDKTDLKQRIKDTEAILNKQN